MRACFIFSPRSPKADDIRILRLRPHHKKHVREGVFYFQPQVPKSG
jgi:hypothetical protein